jgi:TPR repeat protein
VEACVWFRKAAEQGLPDAEFAMGACCADGIGTPRDLVQACKWAALAWAHGLEEAALFKMATEKRLTAEQKAQAEQAIAEALQPPGAKR